jgi:outer membrane protein assembly factor BamB
LARYDAANTGRVPVLPSGSLTKLWPLDPKDNQGGNAFTSPLVVLGTETVIGYNADGNVYSLFWDQGNQRWKSALQPEVRLAPTLAGRTIHMLNGSSLTSLADQGGSAALTPSPTALPNTPLTPINVWFNTLLLGVGDGGDARLLALRRENPADQRAFEPPSGTIYLPAVGQETIYIGADRLYAIDANLFDRTVQETIWSTPDGFGPITAAPVYAYPGVLALAELYVASGNRVIALDANTGATIWTYDFGLPVTDLAVNETSVVIVGSNQMHLVPRNQTNLNQVARQWAANVAGAVKGGPLITDLMILLVTEDGGILLYDIANGNLVDAGQNLGQSVAGGPAVSSGRIFVAAGNAVHAFQRNP